MIEPVWIEPAQVIEVAETVVADTSEPFRLRDAGLLESAVSAPRNRWHYEGETGWAELGLALALAIARNHPFEQGNKRAAWFSMLTFFALNDVALTNENDPRYADLFIEVIIGERVPEDLLSEMTLVSQA